MSESIYLLGDDDQLVELNDEITNSIARSLTGIGSENKVKKIFQGMMRAGELEAIPGRSIRYAAYRLPGAAGTDGT